MASQQKVVVVGGGPVGALAALYTARRGFQVELYDLRDRQSVQRQLDNLMNNTNSDPNFGDPNARPAIALIPLDLSERGIRAIEGVGVPGLIEDVLAGSRPIHTRMVHSAEKNGNLTEIAMPYGPNGEVLISKTGFETYLTFSSSAFTPCLEKKLQNVFC